MARSRLPGGGGHGSGGVFKAAADYLRSALKRTRGKGGHSPPGGLGGRTPHGTPAHRADLANKVPPYGTKGTKTSGLLDHGNGQQPFDSGYEGPAKHLPRPRPGMHNRIASHVEAHSAAYMRQNNVRHFIGGPD
jgi:hypothetical protein